MGIILIFLIPVIFFVKRKQNSINNTAGNKLLTVITKTLQSSKVPKINAEDAAQHQGSYIFLDAREKEEYDVSHVQHSIYIGDQDFNIHKLSQISKKANIIVYCAVGVRSDKIAQQIIDAGYSHVQNMFGGIFEWINTGHAVYDNTGNSTKSIHAYSGFWGMFVNSDHKVYNY
ncbi:MAG: rhodanese-like domain-containing protein [Ginsengibacter sp.]